MTKRKYNESAKETPKKVRKPFEDEWSKSKKKRMRRLKAKQAKMNPTSKPENAQKKETKSSLDESEKVATKTPSSALQESFKARLTGSRFRELNEVCVSRKCAASCPSHGSHILSFYTHRNFTRQARIPRSNGFLLNQSYTSSIMTVFATRWNNGR